MWTFYVQTNHLSFSPFFSKYLECVLLDDGGFLIMANQDDYISKVGLSFTQSQPLRRSSIPHYPFLTSGDRPPAPRRQQRQSKCLKLSSARETNQSGVCAG